MIPELDAYPCGRDSPLAEMLEAMTPLDRGILLATNPSGIVPALIAELRLAVVSPYPPVRQTAENGGGS